MGNLSVNRPCLCAGCSEGDCGTDERLERAGVNRFPLMDVDCVPCLPVEVRVEEEVGITAATVLILRQPALRERDPIEAGWDFELFVLPLGEGVIRPSAFAFFNASLPLPPVFLQILSADLASGARLVCVSSY